MLNEDDISEISERLNQLPKQWNGKDAILEMKTKHFNQWRQMEWIGFYFEFLCQQYLKDIMQFHKIKFGRTSFDSFYKVPFDFKAHAINTEKHSVVINDTMAIQKSIQRYGYIITIIALGEVKYNDEQRSFQRWHEKLKGGKSKYERDRIERGAWSRLRKTEFHLKEILLLKINKETLNRSGSFQKNFRNADGSLRRSKVMLNLEKLEEGEIIKKLDF